MKTKLTPKTNYRPNLSRMFTYIFLAAIFILGSRAIQFELPNTLQDFITLSLSVVYEAFPFLVLGSLLSYIVSRYVGAKKIDHVLPKNPLLRIITIGLFGVFLPVCECGNVPLSRSLMQNGLKPGEVMTFLLAAPILNPITIITTMQAFNTEPRIVIWRVVGAFFISQLVGWIFASRSLEDVTVPSFKSTCAPDEPNRHSHNGSYEILQGVKNLMPALLFGACVAGLTQTLIPRSVLTSAGSDPIISILAMLLLAFIVSICANVDAFFALAFSNSFTSGSIIAFLVFGPMIDIKILSLLRSTFKTKTLVEMTAIVLLSSIIIGLAANYV